MVTDTLNPNFGLPDMGDFYYDAPDQEAYFGEMDRHLNSVRRDRANSANAYKFYQEDPPPAGADEKGQVFVFDINLGGKGIGDDDEYVAGIKVDDGDTISIPVDSFRVADDKCRAYLSYVKGYVSTHSSDNKAESVNIRFAGIDSKELPHYRKVPLSSLQGQEIKEVDIDACKGNSDYVTSKYKSWMHSRQLLEQSYDGYETKGTFFKYDDQVSGKVSVVKGEDGKWRQYFDDGTNAYILTANATNDYSPETIADAGLARDVVVNAINDAEAMRIVVDGTQITRDGANIKTMFGTELYGTGAANEAKRNLDMLLDSYTRYQRPGFNNWGQDAYGRCISAVYVKINGKWINLNKLVIADTNKTEINKYANSGDGSTVIDLESYEYDAKDYADSLYADTKKFDDREQVQKQLFGQTWEQLKEWTVTIGDVTLFVPPTSIRVLTQTKAERVPLIRAKGAMAKSSTKNQRIIEMDLYFNEDRGINGYEYKTNTRPDNKGKDITYWMNGLRALYAQFRVAPFLPIDNNYINTVLDVDAVTMVSFTCETVPSFPKLVKATIQLAEFEYRIYMPEIPFDDGDDDEAEVRNYFSKQINYPLFRYYYQRLLRNGEELKGVDFLDSKYIKNTFGNKTCLVPASFVNPYIKFYVPNKNHLEKLKKAKLERMARPNTVRDISPSELQFAENMAKVKNEIDYINTTQNPIGPLNDYLADPSMEGYVLCSQNGNDVGIYKVNNDNSLTLDTEKTARVKSLIGTAVNYYDAGLTSLKREDGQYLCQKQGAATMSLTKDDGSVFSVNVATNVETPNISEDSLNNLRTLSTVSGVASAADTFKNRCINLRLSCDMGKSNLSLNNESKVRAAALGKGNSLFYFDQTADTNFLNFLSEVNNKNGVGGNEDANGAKASIDFISSDTLKFEPYNDDQDFLVEAIHMNTSNTFTQISLLDYTGYAPQYMGGTDISLQISMYTQSKQAASAINALPHISAEFARNYKMVLSSWPLKIETEFTKLFGITDTLVEAVEVDTVPNYPGLYHITMTLVSVDRSLRNRESLMAKDMQNFHNLSIEGVARERSWSYDKISEFLSEAELYPDLELPTLAELGENGFNFIRYSNEKRVYPDPDFYFTYSYVLVSQLIREAVLNALNSDACNAVIRDSMGKEIKGSLAEGMGTWQKNYDLTKGWDKDLQAHFRNDDLIAARMLSDMENVADEERDETWTVAPNIKVAMMEKRMLNRINDTTKQSYKEKNGADMHSSTVYDNAAGIKAPKTDQTVETDENGNITELKDGPEASEFADETATAGASVNAEDTAEKVTSTGLSASDDASNLKNLKKQKEEKAEEKKANSGGGAYSAQVAEKNQMIANRVNSVIEHQLNISIEESGDVGSIVDEVIQRFNTANRNCNATIGKSLKDEEEKTSTDKFMETEQKGSLGKSELGEDAEGRGTQFGMIPAFLDAAADAICSNLGVDYRADNGKKDNMSEVLSVVAGTAAGAVRGAIAGASVAGVAGGVVGGVAGAVAGGVATAAAGEAAEAAAKNLNPLLQTVKSVAGKQDKAGSSDNDDNRPWKHCTKYRGRLKIDGIEQQWSFDDDDPNAQGKIDLLATNAIEFGFFNFKFYTARELEDRFGYYGQIDAKAIMDDGSGAAPSTGSSSEEGAGDASGASEGNTSEENASEKTTVVKPDSANPRSGRYLADPFYRYASAEVQAEYVRKCITDYTFAKQAFLRICLLYMRVLVSYGVFPSFSYDVMRDVLDNEERMKQIMDKVAELRKKQEEEAKAKSSEAKQYGTSKKYAELKKSKAEKKDESGAVTYVGDAVPEGTTGNTKDAAEAQEKKEGEQSTDATASAESASNSAAATANASAANVNASASASSGDTASANANSGDTANNEENKTAEENPEIKDETQEGTIYDSVAENKSLSMAKNVAQYRKLFDKNKAAMDNGKLFLMIAMGVVDGDKGFVKMLVDRKYDALNAITNGACSGQTIKSNSDNQQYETRIRSFIRALAGEGVIKESLIGAGDTEAPSSTFNIYNARQNVAAASEDPNLYMVHSFYDMVVHDCRGRMLRAFPTFYMFLLDEGRKIGAWKLHDNFYNVNSISNITVSKSRKNPTDVAEVTLTNFYNTYTTEDEDLNMNYTSNFTDVFRSLWLPTLQAYAEDEEERRTNAPKANRFRLRPGARIHIRLGYGADASHLPITFNGMIAEVDTGDVVKLICQSDGSEICKPILMEKKASELQGVDELIGWSSIAENGDTPKNIMRSLMCMKGGFINSFMHNQGWDDAANMIGEPINPLGVYHFGNPDYAYAGDAEPVQNIFEVGLQTGSARYLSTPGANKSSITNSVVATATEGVALAGKTMARVSSAAAAASGNPVSEIVADRMNARAETLGREAEAMSETATHLQFEVFGKSIWDVANICRSTDPEYYCAVRPFHMRSTLFIGRSHDYYAYDYVKQGGAWIEKRKPFQQAHIYDSKTDIVDNRIAVSPKNIKTCAIGMYEVEGFMNAKVQKKTDPQWVDAAIYPEYQKTMYVDTKLFGEASRKMGILSDIAGWFTNGITNSTLDRGFDKEGDVQNHHALAVKMTISALKDAMKEMYQGSLVVIGDPTVQPNDRMILNDSYNYINGQCLVRDVVHVFSSEDGFKTVVTPDLITTQVGAPAKEQSTCQQLACLAVNTVGGMLGAYLELKAASKASGRLVKNLTKIKSSEIGQKALSSLNSAKNGIANSGIANKMKNVATVAGDKLKGMTKVNGILSGAGKALASAASSGVSMSAKLGALATDIVELRKMFGPLAWATTIALGAVEDMIASKINSRKTLVIFPLQKFNKPFVGGIDGNVGSVYGSPNFASEDGIQSMFSGIKNGIMEHAPGWATSGILGVGGFLFGEGGLMDIHASFGMSEIEKIANDEGKAQTTYRQVNNSQINNYCKTTFNPMTPRMAVRKSSSIQKAQKLYGVTAKQPDDINVDDHMKQMRSVIHSEMFKNYMTSGFFRVAAHEKGFTADLSEKIKCIYIKNPEKEEYIPINAIFDSNGCYDIPFLHKDAINVLHDVIVRAFCFMAGTEQERDAFKWYEDNKDSFITLTSALKCGSTKSYESTGFSFVLTASDGKSQKALSAAIDFINRQMAETNGVMEAVPNAIMDKKEDGRDIFVVVHPPQR